MENVQALAELERILRRWQRWYRLRRAVSWTIRGLILGLSIALVACLAVILKGRLLREELLFITIAAALSGAGLAALVAAAWSFPALQAARTFDRIFGLRERTSTALELATGARKSTTNPELVHKQLDDALAAARQVRSQAALPLRWRWGEFLAAGILAAAVVLVWARGDAYFQAAFQKRLVQAAIQQQIAQIEALRSQIQAAPSLDSAHRQELTRPLEEALQSLRDSPSLESAVSTLHSTAEQLQALSSAQADQRAQALQEAGNSLRQQQGSELESFGQALADGHFLEAAQQLQNIDPSSLSEEEAQALADQLEETAGALESTDPELAQDMRNAAEALRQGDAASAQSALQQASQALSQAGQQIHQAQVAEQAAGQIVQGQQRVIQAGRAAQGQQPADQSSAGSQASAGQAGGQGQGQKGSQGSGQGSGEGSDNARGSSGGGAGRGEGSGDSGQGPEAGNDPIGQGNAPGDGGERPYEPIYAPQRLGGSGGEEVSVPGSDQPGDQVLGQGNTIPGEPGDSSVPYVEVLPFYEEAYRRAIESGHVPLFLRDLVRRYFSSLQP